MTSDARVQPSAGPASATAAPEAWSERLRRASAPDWAAATRHRFVEELLAGTVADAVLGRYLVQDYQFCDAFTALLGQACASAPALPSRLRFARQLGFFAADENSYFVDSFRALGIPEADAQAPELSEATRAFDALMRAAIESRSYAQVLAVLLVAEWLYLDWAERADAGGDAPLRATRPEHVGWVDLHRGPDFAAWVAWLRAEFDANVPAEAAERAAAEDAFARAVACERAFLDAAYDVPGAPTGAPTDTPTDARGDAANDVRAGWAAFRAGREEELRAPYGWLTLRTFHWLPETPTELAGLPGRWWTTGIDAYVEAAAADGLRIDAAPLVGRASLTCAETARVPWVRYASGDPAYGEVEVELLRRGGRLAIRSRAETSPAREAFAGVPTYDYDPAWVLPGRFTAYGDERRVDVATFRPELRQRLRAVGEVAFTAGGQEHRLVVTSIKYGLSVEFHDPTNGTETEPWRQLKIDDPGPDGTVTLDFNRAINMWFAFTPHATCPAPLEGNTITVPVRAGERRVRP